MVRGRNARSVLKVAALGLLMAISAAGAVDEPSGDEPAMWAATVDPGQLVGAGDSLAFTALETGRIGIADLVSEEQVGSIEVGGYLPDILRDEARGLLSAQLDVTMPKVGGRAVCERIRETRPDLRFLFASGYSMNALHTNFVLDEGLTLIQKPCSRDDLLRRVRGVLDGGDS